MQKNQNRFTFSKQERLTSKKAINDLFYNGKIVNAFPLFARYLVSENIDVPVKVLITVPKKKIKKAVDRNRVKRLMREAFRLNKFLLYNLLLSTQKSIILNLSYSDVSLPKFNEVQNSIIKLFQKIINDLVQGNE